MMMRKYFLFLTTIAVFFSGLLTMRVNASRTNTANQEKMVTSIQIDNGDTLWDIAKQYYTVHNNSIKEYIEEIKECNQLTSNEIHAGQYLIIPYYE